MQKRFHFGVWGQCCLPRPGGGMPRSIWAQEGDTRRPALHSEPAPRPPLGQNWKPGAQPCSQQVYVAEAVPGDPCLLQNAACGQGSAARLTVTLQEHAGKSREGQFLHTAPQGWALSSSGPQGSPVVPVLSGERPAVDLVSHPPCSGAPILGHFYGLPSSATLERQAK